ncbi:MAG: Uncharacterized protein G01um10147_847 [Microgenomates group bacterium Gr01-1014_7]|nr:MAG: Uncharacterized protein G01um10147_847 [Microgenomates group bacterium Gr01-1014_7]
MTKTLKDTLREIQITLGKPHKTFAGALKYYLSFLNITEAGEKLPSAAPKTQKIDTITYGKITWADVKDPTRREIAEIAKEYPFHPLHLEDCISRGQSLKIEQNDEDKYLFLLFRFPYLNPHQKSITINQICFFLGENYLVTVHENATDTISTIFNDCKESQEQRKAYIGTSSSHLLYTIINKLTDDLSPVLDQVLKEVEEAEDVVFDDKVSGVYKIGQLRRKIISLRRVIGPLRTLLADIAARINKFSSTNFTVYFENITHQVEKTWETLEEARETVEIYKDSDFTYSTEKTNKILSVLTIIFTLSIPATVLGTFYGMNILLPGGLESDSWNFWGKYTSFIIIILAASIPALLMQMYFRKRGWF